MSGGGSRRGRMKQIPFRAAVKKSNRALLGADFLGTANRKFEGWGSPGVEVEERVRSRYGLHQPALIPDPLSLYHVFSSNF